MKIQFTYTRTRIRKAKSQKKSFEKQRSLKMNYLIQVLSVALVLSVLTACGSSGGNVGNPTSEDKQSGCPIGELFSTNGERDFISIGNDNLFQMERKGAAATGYVSCTADQKFILTIESTFGNCLYPGCASSKGTEYHNVFEKGTYSCQWSLAANIVTIFCPSPGNIIDGNVMNPGMSYLLPR